MWLLPFVTVIKVNKVLLWPPRVGGAHTEPVSLHQNFITETLFIIYRALSSLSEAKSPASARSLNAASDVTVGPRVRNDLVFVSFQPVI